MEKNLEKRMYFFVPYQLTGIQQAIQAGHAALEYARQHQNEDNIEYIDFIDNWKTWIILNGGTTNGKPREGVINIRDTEDPYKGSLDNIYVEFIRWNRDHKDQPINHSVFFEPDLNDALTAVCFIADERVFNYEDYPDFKNHLIETSGLDDSGIVRMEMTDIEKLIEGFPSIYKTWVKNLGGKKNVFLRELLKGKKLA